MEGLDTYLQLLRELDLTLACALDTHTHADHITASGRLRDLTGCLTYLGKEAGADCVSQTLSDGQQINLGKLILTALFTPGHTDDSYSFVVIEQGQHYLFSGDTLLIRGTGRTDFQNGSARDQYRSLHQKLLSLPDSTWVYPAHDYKGWSRSSIGEERQFNPRLQVRSEADYVELMSNLKLASPKMMDIAISANRACGKL